jgi:hypothetical protein
MKIDPFMKIGLTAFFIPVALGCLAYMLATFLAWLLFSKPHHFYMGRIYFLAVFLLIAAMYSTPNWAFSGPYVRFLPILVRMEGAEYGKMTLPIWLIIALFKRPKTKHETIA